MHINKIVIIALLSTPFAAQADLIDYYQRQRALEEVQAAQEELREANRIAREQQKEEETRYLLDNQRQRYREIECQFGPDVFGGSCR